ncbi:MAG: aromatic ring-hydroxylating oxygenase subunit alpha, partial [Candidatus Binataceae bacterium]
LLTCRFHSWAFDPEGALKWVSDEENFYDIDKRVLGLKKIHADSWQGFVFINLADSPEQTLAEYLGGVAQQLGEFPFNDMRLMFRYRVEEDANWKVILDAQNEVYHIPFLHISTYPDFCPTNRQNFSRILDFRRFGRHTVYSVEFNPEHQPSAVEALAIRTQPAAPQSGSSRIGWFDFYTVFPNFCILFPPGACSTYNIWPLSVNRAIWEISFYQLPPEKASERFSLEYWRCRNRDLLQEDASNHEAVQASLKSRAISHFMMQDEEIQLRHFHKVLRDEIARP